MVNYGGRGKKLEILIDKTNKYYSDNGWGSIKKIPHPFQTMKVTPYKVEGFFKKGYLVDYMGTTSAGAIIFDAKETKGKSYPLKNTTEGQLSLLAEWDNYGADSFLIIHFVDEDKYFKVESSHYIYLTMLMEGQGKKSINIMYFEDAATEIFIKEGKLDYLEVINE